MSIQPVTTSRPTTQSQMEMNIRATTSGLSAVTSTITSAATTTAAPASPGFFASISAWISSVVEGIRGCLANLPLIGWCFGSAAASSSSSIGSSTAVDPLAAADVPFVNIIKSIFKPAPAAATSGATSTVAMPAVPGMDIQNFAMDQFNAIQTPAAKWEALAAVLSACNSADPIKGNYYRALTPAMQDQFRGEMYRVNAGSVFPAGGHDHGIGFGLYMVANQLGSDVAIQAARNLHANPVVAP